MHSRREGGHTGIAEPLRRLWRQDAPVRAECAGPGARAAVRHCSTAAAAGQPANRARDTALTRSRQMLSRQSGPRAQSLVAIRTLATLAELLHPPWVQLLQDRYYVVRCDPVFEYVVRDVVRPVKVVDVRVA